MLKQDLAAAGIPYKDDRGDAFDFHALRGECASLLIESGVAPKQAQEIMRHSSIGLTMDTYAKVLGKKRKAQAVASLPDLSLPESQQQEAVRTGTDAADVTPESLRKVYSQDDSHRTESDSIGHGNSNSDPETAIVVQNRGHAEIVDPGVAGSNPVFHPSHLLESPLSLAGSGLRGAGLSCWLLGERRRAGIGTSGCRPIGPEYRLDTVLPRSDRGGPKRPASGSRTCEVPCRWLEVLESRVRIWYA